MGVPLPFTRRGCIVFPAIRCSSPLLLPAGPASTDMLPGEELSRWALPGITLPLPPNFGVAPFANPDFFLLNPREFLRVGNDANRLNVSCLHLNGQNEQGRLTI